jgi:hypothetical protein
MNTALGISLVTTTKIGEILIIANKGINGKSTPAPGCGGCGGSGSGSGGCGGSGSGGTGSGSA